MEWEGRGILIERNVRFFTHMQPYRPALHADTGKVQPQTDRWAKAETPASTASQTHKAEEKPSRCTVPLYCPSLPPSVSLPSLVERKSHKALQPKHLNPSAPLTCRGPMTQTHSPHSFSRKHSSKAIIREKKAGSILPSVPRHHPPPQLTPQPHAAQARQASRRLKEKEKKTPPALQLYTHLLSLLPLRAPATRTTHAEEPCFRPWGIGKDGPFSLSEKGKIKRTFKKKLYSHDSLTRDRRLPSLTAWGRALWLAFWKMLMAR